jgi:hypothetical protein
VATVDDLLRDARARLPARVTPAQELGLGLATDLEGGFQAWMAFNER